MKFHVLFFFLLLACASCVTTPPPSTEPKAATEMSFLSTSGRLVLDEQGQPAVLRGFNAGNWLLIEPWMLGVDLPAELQSEKDIWDLMGQRFGEKTKLELIRAFRNNFFTRDDVRRMSELGLNSLRIPLWWRATDDPSYAGDLAWLDHCIAWCREFGVYAIIDLHGAPGGQTRNGVIVGERTDADLWKDKKFQDQTVDWWVKIARRYKNEPAVAAYDLLNEAIDGPFDEMVRLYARLYDAIRQVDPRHILIIEDGLHGFHRLPHPRQMGWENVIYSFHYYPQSPDEAADAPATIFQKFNRAGLYYGVPVYVGEFNTLKFQRGGVETIWRYMQAFDYFDWPWSLWSYKKIESNWDYNWGLYGYDRHPRIRFQTDAAEDIRAAFEKMNTEQTGIHPFFPTALQQPPAVSQTPAGLPEGTLFLPLKDAFLFPEGGKDLRMDWSGEWPAASYWGTEDRLAWTLEVPADGRYRLNLMMANAAPKVGVEVWLNGVRSFISPIEKPTGDWSRFEPRTAGILDLQEGRNVLEIASDQSTESFMNLRYAWLEPVQEKATKLDEKALRLAAINMSPLPAASPLRVEWLNDPTGIGYWKPGEKASWTVRLSKAREYRVSMTYATPNDSTTLALFAGEQMLLESKTPSTKEWSTYETVHLGKVKLPAGVHTLTAQWNGTNSAGCGNLAEIRFKN